VKVRIQNYQTSKDTELELKGFTVIVGKSNTGKTGLLRAIEGSMFNDSVKGKTRHGESTSIVTVEHDDVSWVWKKGGGHNDYIVTTAQGTKDYSKVGFKVPDEIRQAGFREVVVDGDKIRPQVAEWHDPIFLLNRSGKVITEMMAAVTRLDVVNLSQRKCASKIRKAKSTIKVREGDLITARDRVKLYDPLDNLGSADVDTVWAEYQEIEQRLEDIRRYESRYTQLNNAIEALAKLDDCVVPDPVDEELSRTIARLSGWETKLSSADSRLSALEPVSGAQVPEVSFDADLAAVKRLAGWELQLARLDKALDAYSVLDGVEVPTTDGLNDAAGDLPAINGFLKRLVSLAKDMKAAKADHEKAVAALEADEAKLEELRGGIEVCPVCGSEPHGSH
jgi:DNA repair ATPase RecN